MIARTLGLITGFEFLAQFLFFSFYFFFIGFRNLDCRTSACEHCCANTQEHHTGFKASHSFCTFHKRDNLSHGR